MRPGAPTDIVDPPDDTAAEARRQLLILALALVLTMSPWFSTSAVSKQLSVAWDLSATALAWLVIAVQLGFVSGAVVITMTGLADRFGPRRLVFAGALLAATANALLIVAPGFGLIGFLVEAPWYVVVPLALFWGFWVVADSAQFSTIVTEVVEPRVMGTALTLQLSLGFVLTVFTIFLVPLVRDAAGWGVAFLMLAPGPALGAFAMARLERTLG